MSEDNKNYYEVLEISPNADSQVIYHAYQQAKNTYTMDSLALYSLMTKDECEKMIEQIEEAYSILSDPDKRIQYNNARGLESPNNTNQRQPIQPQIISPKNQSTPNRGPKISKIIANNRFNLEYDINPDFEQEIEQITSYTGEFLQKIRNYKNVEINRMSEMTKISKTYIQKIENEDMDNLPALVYVRGFVYQYAKCLKLNPELVATSYLEHLKATHDL